MITIAHASKVLITFSGVMPPGASTACAMIGIPASNPTNSSRFTSRRIACLLWCDTTPAFQFGDRGRPFWTSGRLHDGDHRELDNLNDALEPSGVSDSTAPKIVAHLPDLGFHVRGNSVDEQAGSSHHNRSHSQNHARVAPHARHLLVDSRHRRGFGCGHAEPPIDDPPA